MPRKESLPAKLRRLREAAGLSQAVLGAAIGVTQGAIGHFESGRKAVPLETLHALAVALGHDPHDLDARLASRSPSR